MRPTPHLSLITALVAFAVASSGCIGGDDPEPNAASDADDSTSSPTPPEVPDPDLAGTGVPDVPNATGNTSGIVNNDTEVAPPAPPCTPSVGALASWTWDPMATPDPTTWDPASADPVAAISVYSEAPVAVSAATTRLMITGMAGDHVSPAWKIWLEDPAGAEVFAMSGGPPPNAGSVTGEGPVTEVAEITAPAPGSYLLKAQVAGYLAEASIEIDSETCT